MISPQADPAVSPVAVFDRPLVRLRRQRALPRLAEHRFLYDEMAASLADRVALLQRAFPVVAIAGDRGGALREVLAPWLAERKVIYLDTVLEGELERYPAAIADEEALPLAPESVDAVLSCGTLHWANDLPGAFIQMRRALRPDGVMLAAMSGGETLAGLRQAMNGAELAVRGGVSPRLSPMADVRDMGGLLQRAGFALPVVDNDTLTVSYENITALMRDLRGMGETNAVSNRDGRPLNAEMLAEASAQYPDRDTDGRLLARFEMLFLTGWAPAATQQQPLRPGSARHRLADALRTEEHGTGDYVSVPHSKSSGIKGDDA
mgnify:CR=1 FL=1